jgi:hypothetical protein
LTVRRAKDYEPQKRRVDKEYITTDIATTINGSERKLFHENIDGWLKFVGAKLLPKTTRFNLSGRKW